MKSQKTFSPALWVPTLYFAEAIPYMAVMTLSVIMYTNLGLTNTELALYTSWLYLPWVIKPLWSPLVDARRTKRWWIVVMQLLVGAALAGVALTLNAPWWLRGSLCFFWLMAFSSATHDIAADGFYILGLSEKDQALYVGVRSTFYRIGMIFCQGAIVMLAGWMEQAYSVPLAWSITMLLLAVLMILLSVWHGRILPRVEDKVVETNVISAFMDTLRAFFSRPAIVSVLFFMLLFRMPEALLAKMAQPFMLRSIAEGGLELSTVTVGFTYGTVGVVCLLAGGLLGGWLASRHGLRRWWWPMVLAISVPDLVYVYLAYVQPSSLWVINACVALEQFGYGLGFTAYSLFLVYFARGEKSTSVFSLCTALQALGMMLPGMIAGWLADELGFRLFFVMVVACCAVTFLVSALVSVGRYTQAKTPLMLIAGMVLLLSSCGPRQTELFNGRDLDGWVTYTDPKSPEDAAQTFTVSDGLIRISGKPFGYMRTAKKYTDFVLHTEWRWAAEPADGGIFVLLQDGDRIWPTGIQCQMKGADMGVLMGGIPIAGVEGRNGFYMKRLDSMSQAEHAPGEWNETDITCRSGHVSVSINGILVNEAECEAQDGYIALQSEGGAMEFRTVCLLPVNETSGDDK